MSTTIKKTGMWLDWRYVTKLSIPLIVFLVLSTIIWILPDQLSNNGKFALIVMLLAIVGWAMSPISDSIVAIFCVMLLFSLGVIAEQEFLSLLGHDVIWLLAAAFVMASILRSSGLLEPLLFRVLRSFSTVTGLFYGLTAVIAFTAFLIPSTSGRAALLLPVFLLLADKMPDERLIRPLALLFPTVILLSAGGSLIGAGANILAADIIQRSTGQTIGYLDWILIAFPFSILSCFGAVWLIIRLFVSRSLSHTNISTQSYQQEPLKRHQKTLGLIVTALILAWLTIPIHGLGMIAVTLIGTLVMLLHVYISPLPKPKFKFGEIEIIFFLAATVTIADALIENGSAKWLASGILNILPETMTSSLPVVIVLITLVALLSHIFINSRSARAAVLIPTLALPIAGFGHDTQLIIMVTILGTGFCQTMIASAKPLIIYSKVETETFQQKDLLYLALPLLPFIFALLVSFALFVWPHQLENTTAH